MAVSVTEHTVSETSARTAALTNERRICPDCILYQLPPETRKEVFKAVLALYFEAYSKGRDICYHVSEKGWFHVCPQNGQAYGSGIIFAGRYKDDLPALETALFPDVGLHGEFITTRIEASNLVLMPGVVTDPGMNWDYFNVHWPRINKIPLKVRSLVRSIAYELE